MQSIEDFPKTDNLKLHFESLILKYVSFTGTLWGECIYPTPLARTGNWIWWQCTNSGEHGNLKNHFIAITSWSVMVPSRAEIDLFKDYLQSIRLCAKILLRNNSTCVTWTESPTNGYTLRSNWIIHPLLLSIFTNLFYKLATNSCKVNLSIKAKMDYETDIKK